MKKILLFLTLILIQNINAQCDMSTGIVNIPDENFKALLLNNHTIDTDGDSEISCEEASNYTGSINVSSFIDILGGADPLDPEAEPDFEGALLLYLSTTIRDLTGIEAFESITTLRCSNNLISSLDLSSNTALTELYCSFDANSLETLLEFSGFMPDTDPFYQDIEGNSGLTSLNVSNNSALRVLYCNNNELTSLDVSNNPMLEDLRCYNNELISLNVSNNEDLTVLHCYNNELLTSLDVSNNLALVRLDCSETNLEILDVSLNTALGSLDVSETNLEILDVSLNTALGSLDVSETNLETLNVANNNNTNFTSFKAQNNPSLSCIQVDDVSYSDANWPNKDEATIYSLNCSASLSTEDNFITGKVNIYPNPAYNTLNIELSEELESAEIFTLLGKKVLVSDTKTIDVSTLLTNIYVLKITTVEGNSVVRKISKK